MKTEKRDVRVMIRLTKTETKKLDKLSTLQNQSRSGYLQWLLQQQRLK